MADVAKQLSQMTQLLGMGISFTLPHFPRGKQPLPHADFQGPDWCEAEGLVLGA